MATCNIRRTLCRRRLCSSLLSTVAPAGAPRWLGWCRLAGGLLVPSSLSSWIWLRTGSSCAPDTDTCGLFSFLWPPACPSLNLAGELLLA